MQFAMQSSGCQVIFREVILLCGVEEASYREIAEILSIPMGAVMSRLARARKAVRESLRRVRGTARAGDFSHQEFFSEMERTGL
jgi:DNA-directed RNA polymerase specialized sigma24 family protein